MNSQPSPGQPQPGSENFPDGFPGTGTSESESNDSDNDSDVGGGIGGTKGTGSAG